MENIYPRLVLCCQLHNAEKVPRATIKAHIPSNGTSYVDPTRVILDAIKKSAKI